MCCYRCTLPQTEHPRKQHPRSWGMAPLIAIGDSHSGADSPTPNFCPINGILVETSLFHCKEPPFHTTINGIGRATLLSSSGGDGVLTWA
jgi:hypothetical protein